jgi:hypothetical protein
MQDLSRVTKAAQQRGRGVGVVYRREARWLGWQVFMAQQQAATSDRRRNWFTRCKRELPCRKGRAAGAFEHVTVSMLRRIPGAAQTQKRF